jgi:hypothetical protein
MWQNLSVTCGGGFCPGTLGSSTTTLWRSVASISITHSLCCEVLNSDTGKIGKDGIRTFFWPGIHSQGRRTPLMLWVRIPLMARCTQYNVMWQKLSVTCGGGFCPGTLGSSTNKTNYHDIAEILLKVALNTILFITLILHLFSQYCFSAYDSIY